MSNSFLTNPIRGTFLNADGSPLTVKTIKSTYIAGETFEAGRTFVVRLKNADNSGTNYGKVYKHAGQASAEIAFGFAQNPGYLPIPLGSPIDVYQYGPMDLLAGDPDLGVYSPGSQVFVGTTVGSWDYSQNNKTNPAAFLGEFITQTKIFVAPFNKIPINSINDAQIYLREGQTLRAWNSLSGGTFYDLLLMNSAQKLCFATYPYNQSNMTVTAIPMREQSFAADLVATTNITQIGFPVIDGITPVDGTRVLCVGQSSAVQNGVWRAAVGGWARVTDLDYGPIYFRGLDIYVRPGGTTYGNTTWRLSDSNINPPVVGTNTLVFTKTTPIDNKEALTLDVTDVVTNQYKDLAFTVLPNSLSLSISTTGLTYFEGTDYTLSTVSGVTRVTVVGASNLNAVFLNTAVLQVQYRH